MNTEPEERKMDDDHIRALQRDGLTKKVIAHALGVPEREVELSLARTEFREKIADRSSEALQRKISLGEYTGGKMPYGYRRAADGEHLEQVPEEQVILREAQRLRAAGFSLRAVSRELNRQGFKSRVGRAFGPAQLAAMTDHFDQRRDLNPPPAVQPKQEEEMANLLHPNAGHYTFTAYGRITASDRRRGAAMRAWRKEHRLRQIDAARMIGLNSGTAWSKIEAPDRSGFCATPSAAKAIDALVLGPPPKAAQKQPKPAASPAATVAFDLESALAHVAKEGAAQEWAKDVGLKKLMLRALGDQVLDLKAQLLKFDGASNAITRQIAANQKGLDARLAKVESMLAAFEAQAKRVEEIARALGGCP